MKKILSGLAVISTLLFNGYGQSLSNANRDQQDNGKLVAKETYIFPSYEEASKKTGVTDYASEAEYSQAVADAKYEFFKLQYMSDGLKVVSYLCKPKSDAKLPVIIFNRGSFVRGDIAPELISFFHRLVSEGFVILAPMYRQSDGGEGRDEMGGNDVHDLMNILPLIKSFSFADTSNIFMYGESRGGIMTYLALKNQFPVKAAAVFGAITDLDGYAKAHSAMFTPQVLSQTFPGYEQNKDNIMKERSAIFWPDKLNVPVLIMHGGSDPQVNPSQSLAIAGKLQDLGKPYQLKIYAGDNHILSKNKIERDRETVAWFKAYLKK